MAGGGQIDVKPESMSDGGQKSCVSDSTSTDYNRDSVGRLDSTRLDPELFDEVSVVSASSGNLLAIDRVREHVENTTHSLLFNARSKLHARESEVLWNPNDKSDEISLNWANHCAVKTGKGLYRSVRADKPVGSSDPVYFEVKYLDVGIGSSGGALVGLASSQDLLNKSVGTFPGSIGYHSKGKLLVSGKWVDYGAPWKLGSTVGVLATLSSTGLDLHFTLDGVDQGPYTIESTVAHQEYYPMLTLLAQDSKALCLFAPEDLSPGPLVPPNAVTLSGESVSRVTPSPQSLDGSPQVVAKRLLRGSSDSDLPKRIPRSLSSVSLASVVAVGRRTEASEESDVFVPGDDILVHDRFVQHNDQDASFDDSEDSGDSIGSVGSGGGLDHPGDSDGSLDISNDENDPSFVAPNEQVSTSFSDCGPDPPPTLESSDATV